MKITASLLTASLLAGIPVIGGCGSQTYDPSYWHQNFVGGLQREVGKNFSAIRGRAGLALDEYLVSRTDLPSGHIAYKYRYQGTCRYTFEVDPKTDIIVAATWEGEERHCAIVP